MSRQPQSSKGTDKPVLPRLPISESAYATPEKAERKPDKPSPYDDHPSDNISHKFLSPHQWAIFAHGVGGVKDAEHQTPVHPTHYWWPPKGMPPGLYRDVVLRRVKYNYMFHMASTCRWVLMVLQLFIGATLTALGTQSFIVGTPITVLGAVNTVVAGILAMLHNSGLPDRYRYNMAEFEEIEDHLKEVLDTGIIPAEQTIDQVLTECFDLFQDAKATVMANMPVTYNSRQVLQSARQSAIMVSSGPQPVPRAPKVTIGGEKASSITSDK